MIHKLYLSPSSVSKQKQQHFESLQAPIATKYHSSSIKNSFQISFWKKKFGFNIAKLFCVKKSRAKILNRRFFNANQRKFEKSEDLYSGF